jgi:hypothetical protein
MNSCGNFVWFPLTTTVIGFGALIFDSRRIRSYSCPCSFGYPRSRLKNTHTHGYVCRGLRFRVPGAGAIDYIINGLFTIVKIQAYPFDLDSQILNWVEIGWVISFSSVDDYTVRYLCLLTFYTPKRHILILPKEKESTHLTPLTSWRHR